jgi:uncharacterized protein YkwD
MRSRIKFSPAADLSVFRYKSLPVISVCILIVTLCCFFPGKQQAQSVPVLDSEEQEFLRLINEYRASYGLSALEPSISLTNAAKWMSTDMASKNYFSHTDSLGRDPFVRMAAFGYSYSTYKGENIAAGNEKAQATFNQWKSSSGHNSNMLNAGYKVIGIGRAYHSASTYRWYWTTDFGGYTDALIPAATPTPPPDPALDSDKDSIPDTVEPPEGRNPNYKDNDIFNLDRLFAMEQYRDFLGREGDSGGISYWTDALASRQITRAQEIESFYNSGECQGIYPPIARLYFAAFNRIPDYNGLMDWANAYRSGMPLTTIAQAFVDSAEFQVTYGNLDNSQFVTLLYKNVLGRDPDPGGYAYWTGQLSGGASRGEVLLGFSESQEHKTLSSDKVYVTMIYVGMLRKSPDQPGYEVWLRNLSSGQSRLTIIQNFLDSTEYRLRFLP